MSNLHPLHPHSPWRIFAFSTLASVGVLIAILFERGLEALTVALILIAVEVAFSFDNAIINAKVLAKMSPFWQKMFLTVGALIAIFGMRIVFPILIVAITADLSWGKVLELALHHPGEYAHHLEEAHPSISAFGGAFLMVLALDFFADSEHEVLWFTRLERKLQKVAEHWGPPLITALAVAFVTALPFNHHKRETFIAGLLGVLVYTVIHGLTSFMDRLHAKRGPKLNAAHLTGFAAFMSFLYLEVLDASFSFDGVIGAFAVTNEVILIAAGLGIGALWVRSLTIYMVRRGTLGNYKYIDHGAHYTIFILACLLFTSIMYNVPEVIVGLTGITIIVASIIASRLTMKAGSAGKKGQIAS
jgi:hypothetical protein